MPGKKSEFVEDYVTSVAEYRTGLSAADPEPPATTIDTIDFSVAVTGGGNQGPIARIGASNRLFIFLGLGGGGMNITANLWRIQGGVAYACTPAAWAAVAASAVLVAENLAAGNYAVTVTGVFNAHDVDILEQHTE